MYISYHQISKTFLEIPIFRSKGNVIQQIKKRSLSSMQRRDIYVSKLWFLFENASYFVDLKFILQFEKYTIILAGWWSNQMSLATQVLNNRCQQFHFDSTNYVCDWKLYALKKYVVQKGCWKRSYNRDVIILFQAGPERQMLVHKVKWSK